MDRLEYKLKNMGINLNAEKLNKLEEIINSLSPYTNNAQGIVLQLLQRFN